jgi:hypothetical protein
MLAFAAAAARAAAAGPPCLPSHSRMRGCSGARPCTWSPNRQIHGVSIHLNGNVCKWHEQGPPKAAAWELHMYAFGAGGRKAAVPESECCSACWFNPVAKALQLQLYVVTLTQQAAATTRGSYVSPAR